MSTPGGLIVVPSDGWGMSSPRDILAVCASVVECFADANGEAPLDRVQIEWCPDEPIALYGRDPLTGAARVQVSAADRLWARLAFQFAHEWTHILANVADSSGGNRHSFWFEEALCELASLFALRRMSRTWRTLPPYENWADYAEDLGAYSDRRLADPARQLPAGMRFSEWLAVQLPMLLKNPRRREDNTIVARQLLSFFETDPDAWRAVRYLGDGVHGEWAGFFDRWRARVPERLRDHVTRIEQLIGQEAR